MWWVARAVGFKACMANAGHVVGLSRKGAGPVQTAQAALHYTVLHRSVLGPRTLGPAQAQGGSFGTPGTLPLAGPAGARGRRCMQRAGAARVLARRRRRISACNLTPRRGRAGPGGKPALAGAAARRCNLARCAEALGSQRRRWARSGPAALERLCSARCSQGHGAVDRAGPAEAGKRERWPKRAVLVKTWPPGGRQPYPEVTQGLWRA
jgi:hypothetical protein